MSWQHRLHHCSFHTSSFFILASRQVGAVIVNRVRLLLTATLLMPIHFELLGSFLPLSASPERWFWLGSSGLVRLVLGEAFLFQAFIWIGPRLSMLMMSLASVFATIFAWFLLGEILYLWQIIGILLTIGGIIWVVQERGGAINLTATNPNH